MKKIFLFSFLLGISFVFFSFILWEWTLSQTSGKCDSLFICNCKDIGPGICDGIHDHFAYSTLNH